MNCKLHLRRYPGGTEGVGKLRSSLGWHFLLSVVHYPQMMPCSRESPLSSSGFTCGKARQFLNRNSYHMIFRKITQYRVISNMNSGRQSVRVG